MNSSQRRPAWGGRAPHQYQCRRPLHAVKRCWFQRTYAPAYAANARHLSVANTYAYGVTHEHPVTRVKGADLLQPCEAAGSQSVRSTSCGRWTGQSRRSRPWWRAGSGGRPPWPGSRRPATPSAAPGPPACIQGPGGRNAGWVSDGRTESRSTAV